MTLSCPICSKSYTVDEAQLDANRQAQCPWCQARTTVPLTADLDEFALAEQMLEALEETQDIETLFAKEGESIAINGNTPLLLDSNEHIWFISDGAVDIFTVRLESGAAVGAREHVAHLLAGNVFFGIPASEYGKERALLAVGALGSTIRQMELSRIQELVQQQEFTAIGVSDLLEQWISSLSEALPKPIKPKECQVVIPGDDLSFPENAVLTSGKRVICVRHRQGSSLMLGDQMFSVISGAAWLPLSKHLWLKTTSAVTLQTISLLDCLAQEIFWESLNDFHLFVLDVIIADHKEREAQERHRLHEKLTEESHVFKNALTWLATVVRTKRQDDVAETSRDPLFTACQVIGKHSGIQFQQHPDSLKGVSANPLQDIARASRVRIRKILLTDGWWNHDHGAFLAYTAEGAQPVALLPISPTSYRIFNPIDGATSKVTAKVAASLDTNGYVFYRPFPNRKLTAKELVSFSMRGSGRDLKVIIIVATLGALLGLLPPIFTERLFNEVIPASNVDQLTRLAVILFATTIAMTLLEITKAIGLLRIEGKMDTLAQAALWDRLLALPVPFFREYTAGDLAVRSLGITLIRQILSGSVVESVFAGIFSLFYFLLLFYYNWKLALVATALGLVAMGYTLLIGYYFVKYQKPVQELEGKISGLLLQLLTGINKLRVTGTEDRAFALWAKEFSAQKAIGVKTKTIQNVLQTVNAIFPVIASMVIFSWVVYKSKGALNTGNFLAFNSAYMSFQGALIQMGASLLSAFMAVPVYDRLRPILSAQTEVDEAKSNPGTLTGHIEVSHVNFRYNPDGPLILQDVSLNITPGEFVAIVGSSGSGKSTLMRMLLGFDKPESGSIYYDGKDLDMVDLRDVRRQIGVVLQNSRIMPGSILENIIGSSSLTVQDAWEAAEMAGCKDDIKAMPMQMHTVLSPGGGTLSGGQRQRILIARTIVKKPRILIFDEATSALDNRTQEIVSQSIEQLNATRIVIAHRLSTIMHADRIYVLEKGRLVQRGTYKELMKQPGIFVELAKRQIA